MKQLFVSIGSIFCAVNFSIKVADVTKDAIQDAIEVEYHKYADKLDRQGAGFVRISGDGIRAEGSIIWWWNGMHTLRIESLTTVKAA